MLEGRNEYIDRAYKHLQVISQDKEKRREYEAREKVFRDHNQFLREATERGFEQGVEVGEQRGIQIGEQRGEQRGILNTAKNMRSEGIDLSIIFKVTGLSIGEIEKL